MTLEEIKKKFPFSGTNSACKFCAYIGQCDKILPGLIKPIKCGGPFLKNKCFEDIINNSKELDPNISA